MSGHSKWNNIKRKKEKTDGAKAAIFTKMAREIAVAVKEGGGPDPANNGKLRDVVAKAKANNVPNDNIARAIKKASDEDLSLIHIFIWARCARWGTAWPPSRCGLSGRFCAAPFRTRRRWNARWSAPPPMRSAARCLSSRCRYPTC